jgi:hypothetical protein
VFSLLDFNSENLQECVKVCKSLNIDIIAYSPIGQVTKIYFLQILKFKIFVLLFFQKGLLTDNLTKEKFSTIRTAKMTRLQLVFFYNYHWCVENLMVFFFADLIL